MTLSSDEAAFSLVLRDWESLPKPQVPDISQWPDALARMAKEEQELRAQGKWLRGRDDFFGVLGLQRAEIRHSAMIAWLLDPCAKHRFGSRFLRAFLRDTFPDVPLEPLEDAQIRCEVARGECRADIVIVLPSCGVTIIVENKVDAVEGERQCDILFECFGKDEGARFLFLTPSGTAPTTATGEAKDAFKSLGYAAVRTMLETVLRETQPSLDGGPGRSLAEDYLRTLKREFR